MAKTVLITGASRGIGRAAARAFALNGYSVAAVYNNNLGMAESLRDEILSHGGRVEP